MLNSGNWTDTWLSGSGFRTVNPEEDFFFCQVIGGTWKLKTPLTITLNPIDQVVDVPVVVATRTGRHGPGATLR